MNRAQLQRLAAERVLKAQTLLDAGYWSGAYYLAGYAIECGLKSCVLAYVEKTGAIFQERKFSDRCWTHDLEELMKLAKLEHDLGVAIAADPAMRSNWRAVKDWSETARYEQRTELQARELYDAITDPAHGVLPWIEMHW